MNATKVQKHYQIENKMSHTPYFFNSQYTYILSFKPNTPRKAVLFSTILSIDNILNQYSPLKFNTKSQYRRNAKLRRPR